MIAKIRVDKEGVYKEEDAVQRCDYALNYDNTTIFVELKGKDFEQAIEQILATNSDAKFPILDNKIAVVVTTKIRTSVVKDNVKQKKYSFIDRQLWAKLKDEDIELTQKNKIVELSTKELDEKNTNKTQKKKIKDK